MIVTSVTKHNKSRWLWLVAGLALITGAGYLAWTQYVRPRVSAPAITGNMNAVTKVPQQAAPTISNAPSAEPQIPASKLLAVPFTPQAPTANWDQLHNEACEEADAIMAAAYFKGRQDTALPADFVESEISKLTEWQQTNFGYSLDITTAEAAVMITKFYGLKAKVVEFPSADEIKQIVAAGNLVIFSANGQLLGNPNYKQPGPIHHMLLIKGYDPSGFITNDSGTKKGLNYAYDYETLRTAAADWDHTKKTVDTDEKLAIIISK